LEGLSLEGYAHRAKASERSGALLTLYDHLPPSGRTSSGDADPPRMGRVLPR
jgi:hypothetical protein